ncbi:MAG: hypothetical protein QF440_02735 [Candidatus Thalassarchaeaceae archaeon]|nr:hypothetical protein [Candidatus Thalassarchaeaceae archaeon]
MDLAEMPWYPKVATSSVTEGNSAPPGFISKTLHLRWDSLPVLLPEGDLLSEEWWNEQTVTWGVWLSGKPQSMAVNELGWLIDFPNHEAQILPLDEDGHARRLAELNCDELYTAIGGLQFEGRDVILIFEKVETEPLPLDEEYLRKAGEVLGRFHSVCLSQLSTPNNERSWNKRLELLEPRTRSATKWRAPHSSDTRGTITHRNFGIEHCQIIDGNVKIGGCLGGVYNAILPENSPSPVLRDVAAGTLNLSSEQKGIFCGGWISTVPSFCSSAKALDSHRGGLVIWEYEQHLERRLFHQAWGEKEPSFVTRFLTNVSGFQNGMYQARSLAAAGLICLSIPPFAILYWLFYPDAIVPSTSDGLAMVALGSIGIFLRRMYRAAAPKPW